MKTKLSEGIKNIYEDMRSKGYNIFNITDPFYQDICIKCKSVNNTDIIISDRIKYIYYNEDSRCQSNCQFLGYLQNTQYINCSCNIEKNLDKKEEIIIAKKFYESFLDVLKYSNFDILKCYKLIFSINIIYKNYGSLLILLEFLIYFVCFLVYIIKGSIFLEEKIKIIVKGKEENNFIERNELLNELKIYKKKKSILMNDKYNIKEKNKINNPPKKKKSSHKSFNFNYDKKGKKIKNNIGMNKGNKKNRKDYHYLNINESNSINSINKIKSFHNSTKDKTHNFEYFNNDNKINEMNNLDSFELNELNYEEAKKYDKRNFIQIYFDTLKREHSIIFTFFICNDYNILIIKYSKFIFLIASDMALNVFFFSDDSMHKVFLNYGKYNFIQQIPKILYSTLISQIIEVFLCYLCMIDKHFYEIKNLNDPSDKAKIIRILKCIKIKLGFYFFFTFIFFGLYWYIVAAFCAVYENTQIVFIKDSLSSILSGIIYQIFIYLIPSSLRLYAIRNQNSKLECIYKLSDIIPFF